MSLKNLAIYLSKEDFEEGAPGEEVVRDMELEVPAPVEGVTEEAVDAAVEDADLEAEEEAELAAGVDEDGAAMTEAQDEVAAVEHFITLLQHGIKHKQFSPQFATLAQDKMEKLGVTLQMPVSVGLEAYGGDAESMEAYYVASLETFTGFTKRLSDLGRRINESIDRGIDNVLFTNGRKKAVASINTQADALISELGAATFTGSVEVNAKGVAKDLSVGKQFPANVMSAVSADQRLTSQMAGAGFTAVTKFMNDLSGCIDGATTSGGPGKTGEWVKKAAGLTKPFGAFPSEVYSAGLMGGLMLQNTDKGAAAGDARAEIRKLAKQGLPTVISNRGTSGDATATLSKADVTNLIKSAKVYAAMADKVVSNGGHNLITNVRKNTEKYERWVSTGDTATWSESKDIGYIVDQMPTVIWRHFQMYRAVTNHCIETAEALLKLAKQAIKSAK